MIHVFPSPEIAFYIKPDVCLGDTVVVGVSAITQGVTSNTWNFEDAVIISKTADQISGGPYYVTWNTTGTHFIHVYALLMVNVIQRP